MVYTKNFAARSEHLIYQFALQKSNQGLNVKFGSKQEKSFFESTDLQK